MRIRGAFPPTPFLACGVLLLPPALAIGQEEAQRLGEVVITGSRIAKRADDTTGPVIVVTPADFERLASDSVAKVLQSLPAQTGATLNTNVNDGGDGSARINLRGLGDQRTLVLVNGRRFVFGGTGADSSVDLNMIPVGMIERVEVSPTGASAIYGADAVAGVVNIITRQNFAGAEAQADYHFSERGDGIIRTARLLAGFDSGEGNLTIGAEYVDQAGVSQSARRYSAHVESLEAPGGPVVHSGELSTPEGLFLVPPDNPQGLPSSLYTRVTGSGGQGAADFRAFDPLTDFFDYAPFNYLQTPSERGDVWLSTHRAVTDSVEWFAEGLIHGSRSQQVLQPSDYSNFRAGAAPVDPATGAQVIPANNFYNPFGADIPVLFRLFLEDHPLTYDEDARAYRVLAGLRGQRGRWHWEGAVTWARNDSTQTQTGQLLSDEMRLAVGPSGRDANGNVVCGTPDATTGVVAPGNVIAGCVPLDLFSGQGVDGRGTITPAQLAYVSRTLRDSGVNQHGVVDAEVKGPLGRTAAGDIEWALGAQYRRETGKLALDPLTGSGVTSGLTLGVPSEASFDAREAFAEAHVPLMRDLPGARTVDADLGARYSRFSGFGENTSLQGGMRWTLVPGITLRGTYSQVFRAPGTFELYAAPTIAVGAFPDPCAENPSPEQQVHCAANGVPGGQIEPIPNRGITALFGGNPLLVPESGETWTGGILLNPHVLSGAQMTLDAWHVKLDHAIEFVDPASITDECANTGSPDACRLIHRLPSGSITLIDSRSANLTRYVTDGVDIALGWSRQLAHQGSISARLMGTRLTAVKIKRFESGTTSSVDGTFDGGISWPRWRAQAALDWVRQPWRVSYAAQFIDSFRECGDRNPFFPYLTPDDCRTVGSRLHHDVSAAYHFHSGLTLSAVVENLANTTPPRVNLSDSANTDESIYPLLGRAYVLRVAFDFR